MNLRRAKLRGMDLRGYDLSYCMFAGAQMGGADLRGANLHKCSLLDANISGADLRGAQIQGANLTNAMVCDALLEPASYEAVRARGGRSLYMRGFFFTGRSSLSLDEWGAILDEYHRRCAYCGDSYELMDHFILRSKGGQTWVGNVVPACLACWHAKGNRPRPGDRVIPAEVMGRVAADLQRRAQSHPRLSER